MERNEITFEIIERIGKVSESATGWVRELNLVSWNGGRPKYDIREWSPDHEHMTRGITLTESEMKVITDLIRKRDSQKGERK